MGKKRITQLLDKLHENQQADVQNSATIFTVAQVAVNQLAQQNTPQGTTAIGALAPAATLNKEQLKQQYGSYQACRNAAKEKGIRFKKTPNWEQLAAAFTYFDLFQSLIRAYMNACPDAKLNGISMEFKFDSLSKND